MTSLNDQTALAERQGEEMNVNHSAMKLGKGPKRHDPRTLRLFAYLDTTALPVIPPTSDWYSKVPEWGMMKNDVAGDCTCAGVGHVVVQQTYYHGDPAEITDDEVLNLYEAVTGEEGGSYNPATGANDNGCVCLDVLNYWRQNGIAGHRIGAYASIDPGNLDHLRAAIALLSCAYVGIQLPITAQGQDIWDVTGSIEGDARPGSWGGHCVVLVGYDTNYLYCVTWGQIKRMTWAWWKQYADEAYGLLSEDWVTGDAPAPSGFNLEQLAADLADI